MKKYFFSVMVLVGGLVLPSVSFAADNLWDVMGTVTSLLSKIIPLLVALGVVYFVYGVVMYMIADSEEAKQKGKDTIIFGIIGFAVIVSLWGLVRIVVHTFDPRNDTIPSVDFERLLPGNKTVTPIDPDQNQWVEHNGN